MVKKRSNTFSAVTYAVGDLLTKGARFLLLPLYLVYFSPDEVGALAILQAISLGLTPLFTNGISMTLARFYQEYEPRSEELAATLLVISLASSGLGTVVFAFAFLCFPVSASSLFTPAIGLTWLLSGLLRANSTVLERRYIIRGEAVFYRSLTFIQFLCSTLIIFVLVIFTDMRLLGIAIGEAIAYGGTLLYLSISLLRRAKPDFSMMSWASIWSYTAPLAMHAVFTWAISYADRLILGRFVDLNQIGVYHIGYLLATVVSTIGLSIKNAWLPDFFRLAEHDKEDGRQFSKWLANYYLFMLTVAAVLICFVPPVARMVLPERYLGSLPVMVWVVIALVFQLMCVVLLNPLYYANRTKTVAAISGSSFLVNVVAMLILIPRLGILGAALASLVAYVIAAAMTYWQASQVYALRVPKSRIVCSTALFSVVILLVSSKLLEPVVDLLVNTLWLAISVLMVSLLPGVFVDKSDRNRLLAKIRTAKFEG